MSLRTLVTCFALGATPAVAADLNFCWKGANGYTMTGKMIVPDHKMSNAVLTEADILRFKIAGYHHGQLLGTWDSKEAKPGTTFHLRFDPIAMTFLTGGSFPSTYSQGWNADGSAQDCGPGGFGFNSGNYAQDFCLNGAWLSASSVDPATPLIATTEPVSATCDAVAHLSKAPRTNHSD